MYDRTSGLQGVDAADAVRRDLISKKFRAIENTPPTSAALLQHIKRTAFQAGHIWGQCLITRPFVPSPGYWGWEKCSGELSFGPLFRKPLRPATSCSAKCKRACKRNCKCYKANLQCTSLCACDGQCYGNRDNLEA